MAQESLRVAADQVSVVGGEIVVEAHNMYEGDPKSPAVLTVGGISTVLSEEQRTQLGRFLLFSDD